MALMAVTMATEVNNGVTVTSGGRISGGWRNHGHSISVLKIKFYSEPYRVLSGQMVH